MAGPAAFPRQMMALDKLINSAPSWEDLEGSFFPAGTADSFDPGDDMKEVLFHFSNTPEGRRIVEWLADLTCRAPYPHVGNSLEAAGIAAAKHEARAAVGQTLMRAIAEGEQIWKAKKESKPDA